MRHGTKLAVFAIVCLAQLWAAASGIAKYERTLAEGNLYRFVCAPVDPEDPIRGRYVRLEFDASRSELEVPPFSTFEETYAVLGTDERGDATVTALVSGPPERGDAVRVRAYPRGDATVVVFPFDRYFMAEARAPRAESLYREAVFGDGERTAHLAVRILDHQHAVEGLFIDDVAIEDVLRSEGR